jgi:hypothetical protein
MHGYHGDIIVFRLQVLLVTGMGLVAYHTKEYHDEATKNNPSNSIDGYDVGQFGRYEFFMYTTGVGVGIAVLGFVCALTGQLEKKHGALAVGICYGICLVLRRISSPRTKLLAARCKCIIQSQC